MSAEACPHPPSALVQGRTGELRSPWQPQILNLGPLICRTFQKRQSRSRPQSCPGPCPVLYILIRSSIIYRETSLPSMKPYIHSLNSLLIFTFCESGIRNCPGCSDHFMWCFKNLRVKMEIHSFGCLLALILISCPLSFHLQPVTPTQRVHILAKGTAAPDPAPRKSPIQAYLSWPAWLARMTRTPACSSRVRGAAGGSSGTWGHRASGAAWQEGLCSRRCRHIWPPDMQLGSFLEPEPGDWDITAPQALVTALVRFR